ncbi:ATP-dependent RNA helicase has1-like protein, partial [Drosera capensis]
KIKLRKSWSSSLLATLLSTTQLFCNISRWAVLISIGGKSSRRDPKHFLISVKLNGVFFCVLMLLVVDLTFLLFMILLMIPRVGRTARGEGGSGYALLFLIPEELGFIRYLKDGGVPVVEHDYDKKRVVDIQSHLEKIVSANYYLNKAAKKAYKSYIQAYNSHSMKDVFNVHKLNLQVE